MISSKKQLNIIQLFQKEPKLNKITYNKFQAVLTINTYQFRKLGVDYMREGKINIGKAKATAGYFNKRLSDLGSINSDESASNFLKKSEITLVSRASRQQQPIYSARKSSQPSRELTLLKLEKQRKCIEELQDYIDELEKDKLQKQALIKHLTSQKQEFRKKADSSNQVNAFVCDKYKSINELVLMMNEQLELYEKQKKRWREEIRVKNKQLQSIKDLQQTQIEDLRRIYEEKLEQFTQQWNTKQARMSQTISKLQFELQQMCYQNNMLKEKQKTIDECQEMLRTRRQILKLQLIQNKENSLPNFDNDSSTKCKIAEELAKVKAQCMKYKNQNEGVSFELKYHKRQAQRDSKLIQELRQQIKKQQEHIIKNQDIASANKQASSESYQKVLGELKQLKRQRKTYVDLLETTESVKQQNLLKSKKIQRLRQREEEQIQKITNIFQQINLE